jgi:hypothetical protein
LKKNAVPASSAAARRSRRQDGRYLLERDPSGVEGERPSQRLEDEVPARVAAGLVERGGVDRLAGADPADGVPVRREGAAALALPGRAERLAGR